MITETDVSLTGEMNLQWSANIRVMVRKEENFTHKCNRTTGIKTGKRNDWMPCTSDRQDRLNLHFENGRSKYTFARSK